MDAFRKEVKELSSADILLILEDQVDLYSEEELEILREELESRGNYSRGITEEDRRRNQKLAEEESRRAEKEAEEKARQEARTRELERQRKDKETRIRALKARGCEGYYEYTTLSLVDENNGGLTTAQVTVLLNDYALDGWRLVSAYANELGRNSTSNGVGGYSTGTNATIDQHVLILERFVRI